MGCRGGGAEVDARVYDEIYDVVVAGYGFAGGITAIEAAVLHTTQSVGGCSGNY